MSTTSGTISSPEKAEALAAEAGLTLNMVAEMTAEPEVEDFGFGDIPDDFGKTDTKEDTSEWTRVEEPAAQEDHRSLETPDAEEKTAKPVADETIIENARLKAQLEVYEKLGLKPPAQDMPQEPIAPMTVPDMEDADFLTDEEYEEAFNSKEGMNRILAKVAKTAAATAIERVSRQIVPTVDAVTAQRQAIVQTTQNFFASNPDLNRAEVKAAMLPICNQIASENPNMPLARILEEAGSRMRSISRALGGAPASAPRATTPRASFAPTATGTITAPRQRQMSDQERQMAEM